MGTVTPASGGLVLVLGFGFMGLKEIVPALFEGTLHMVAVMIIGYGFVKLVQISFPNDEMMVRNYVAGAFAFIAFGAAAMSFSFSITYAMAMTEVRSQFLNASTGAIFLVGTLLLLASVIPAKRLFNFRREA